jgi:hypothetical protein
MANTVGLSALLGKKISQGGDPLVLSINELDYCFRNLPRGALTEIIGSRSSGRTALIHAILATSTSLGETCAIIDSADSFDPASATANDVNLDRIFWVRCHGWPDHAMKATDWILHAGGFGVVVLDLCEIAPAVLWRIPLSWWYRFRNAIENTRTTFVVVADQHLTGSCAARVLGMDRAWPIWSGSDLNPLLAGINMTLASRKPLVVAPAQYEARLAG